MIKLTKNDFITSGHKRDCYRFPNDPTKLIKIEKKHKLSEDNLIEKTYYNYLLRKRKSLAHIAKFHGSIETSLGYGLVFERISNYDGSDSKTLSEIIEKGLLKRDELSILIKELGDFLIKNNIVFADVSLVNVLYQIQKNKCKLIIIDGLGGRHFDLKFKMRMLLPFFGRYKIKTQWKKFLQNCYNGLS